MSKQGVHEIISSIREAVVKECWIPALATALTLPDIMGQIEFPEMVVEKGKRKGQRLAGKQYKAWFAKHVEHWFANEQGWDEDGKPINPYFSADMCYRLRCSMLHQGNDDIEHDLNFEDKEDFEYKYAFELRANACNSYGATWVSPSTYGKKRKTIQVCIDVKTLCNALCDEAQMFLEITSNDFADAGIYIVDVAKAMAFNAANEDKSQDA